MKDHIFLVKWCAEIISSHVFTINISSFIPVVIGKAGEREANEGGKLRN